jgi:nucleoside-diphosphate-sugar epimerase
VEVLIAGGHGKIAMLLARRLAEAGDGPRALIRNPEHTGDIEGVGATAIVADLEALEAGELASALEGADAIVFAAGAGPGSGPERKW